MPDLPENPTWADGIYQIEINDPIQGGVDGIDNRQARQLANRTMWLRMQLEQIGAGGVSSGNSSGGATIQDSATDAFHTWSASKILSELTALETAISDIGDQSVNFVQTFEGALA